MRLTLMSHLWFIGWIGLVFSYINDDIRLNKNTRQRLRWAIVCGYPQATKNQEPSTPVEQLLQLI